MISSLQFCDGKLMGESGYTSKKWIKIFLSLSVQSSLSVYVHADRRGLGGCGFYEAYCKPAINTPADCFSPC